MKVMNNLQIWAVKKIIIKIPEYLQFPADGPTDRQNPENHPTMTDNVGFRDCRSSLGPEFIGPMRTLSMIIANEEIF